NEYIKLGTLGVEENEKQVFLKVLLRHNEKGTGALSGIFTNIEETYFNEEQGDMTGTASLAKIRAIASGTTAHSFILFDVVQINPEIFAPKEALIYELTE